MCVCSLLIHIKRRRSRRRKNGITLYIIILTKNQQVMTGDIIKMTIRVWMNKTCEKTFKNDNQRWKMKRSYIYIEYIKLNHHYHHPACTRTCIYAHLHSCPCMFVKRFQSFLYLVLSNYLCPPYTHIRVYMIGIWKKSRFRTIILIFFLHNMRPIMWNKSSQAHNEKRAKKERKFSHF
jgi:hypothetical protein